MNRPLVPAIVLAAAMPFVVHAENDVILSGTFAASVSQFDSDVVPADFDFENNASRIGIFAATQRNRIKAFLNYERGAANDATDEEVREFYAGLAGVLGTAVAGRKSTEYKLSGARLDPFYNTSLVGHAGGFANTGASYGLSGLTNDVFSDNTVAYVSPSIWGLTANAAVFINDNNEEQDDEHSFAAGLSYANADLGMSASLQYLSIGEPDNSGALPESTVAGFPASSGAAARLSATYAWRAFAFGASFEQLDLDDEEDAQDYGFLSATWKPSPRLTLAASYGVVNNTEGGLVNGRPAFDGDGVSLGVFYEVIENFNVYGGGRAVGLDSSDDETTTFAAGFAYSFDVDLD